MKGVNTGSMDRSGLATVLAGAVFFFAVSGPGSSKALGADGVERAFWAAADLLTILAMLQGRGRIGDLALGNPSLLAWPALAMVSSLWSLTPWSSLYQGVQLLMTLLVGYLASSLLDTRRLVLALVLGLALGECASLLLLALHSPAAIAEDGAWTGVYPHKNVLGSMMVLQIMSCVVLVMDGRHRRLAALLILPAAVLLFGSRSGTSLLALALSLAVVPPVLCYRRGTTSFGFCIGLAILGGAALAAILIAGGNVTAAILGQLGKDDTLSGRTVLWQFGFAQIRAAPVIGIGYKAFWESDQTSAAYLRYVIGQELWFFHNNFVDVGVAFGGVGLTVFCWGLMKAVGRSFSIVARDPLVLQLWRPMFVIYVIVEATAECPLFQNHSLQQLLLAVATALPLAATASRNRQAFAVTLREART